MLKLKYFRDKSFVKLVKLINVFMIISFGKEKVMIKEVIDKVRKENKKL